MGFRAYIVQGAQDKPFNKAVTDFVKQRYDFGEVTPHTSHSSWGIRKALWHHQLKNPSGTLRIFVIAPFQTQFNQGSIGWWSDQYLQWKILYKRTNCITCTVPLPVLYYNRMALREGTVDMTEHSHSMQGACGGVEYVPFHFTRAQMLNSCIQGRIVLKL